VDIALLLKILLAGEHMSFELLFGLITFALVSSITPGPNNLMLMSSGANFGFKRTLPHMFGVSLGFGLMVLLVGIGLIQVFSLYPVSYTVLKIASVVYLLYLAFKIATATTPGKNEIAGKPMTFIQAAAFQWVNPKAWTMALTSISVYASSTAMSSIILVAVIFSLVNIPSVSVWAVLGQQLQRWLTNQRRLRLFNASMGLILVCSVLPVIYSGV